MLNNTRVYNMVRLLLAHDVEEKRLIDEARRMGKRITKTECPAHDEIEYEILNAMVDMTNDEIREAIIIYDESGDEPYFERKGMRK